MRYIRDWIAVEADNLLSEWEAIDAILYDEALEAEKPEPEEVLTSKDSPITVKMVGEKGNNKTTASIFDRIKQFFDNLLISIDRFFNEIAVKFQENFMNDKKFLKALNEFRKNHTVKADVNVQNGTYDSAYLDKTIATTTRFITNYTNVTKSIWNDLHNQIMSNTADKDTVANTSEKIKQLFGNLTPTVYLARSLGISVESSSNVHYMYNEIHSKFIGETKVINIGSNGDLSYVRNAEHYLKIYSSEYAELNRTITSIKGATDDMKRKIRQITNASRSQYNTANVLSQRVAEYCKAGQAVVSILRLCATCYIEKAINSRMILQRAYGFQA